MKPILSTHMWVSLSSEQRNKIRQLFSIPRSSHVIVDDGKIVTDGTTTEDFKHLTVEKMQEYLKDDSTDFHKLFDKVLSRVQDEIEGKPFIETLVEITSTISVTDVKTKKNSKK